MLDDFEFGDLDVTPLDIVLISDSTPIGKPQIVVAVNIYSRKVIDRWPSNLGNDDQSQKKDDEVDE